MGKKKSSSAATTPVDTKSPTNSGTKSKTGGAAADTANTGQTQPTKTYQTVNIRHILCEKHDKKEQALAALNAGRKFDDVAREFSEDKARQGGSLGWKLRTALVPEFEPAFSMQISTVDKPVWKECRNKETGYHIFMIEGGK